MPGPEDNPADDVQPTKEEWDEYARLAAIAKNAEMGLLTDEQAQAAYDAAPAVPLSAERIQEIVAYATASPGAPTKTCPVCRSVYDARGSECPCQRIERAESRVRELEKALRYAAECSTLAMVRDTARGMGVIQ